MAIKFGPAGLGGKKEAIENLKLFHKLGIKACEIAFTYGAYIKEKQKQLISEIRKKSKEYNIQLTIHAPYWINLNSRDEKKIEKSKKRIINCCKIGNLLRAKLVVFHPGYYGGDEKKVAFEQIKNQIIDIQKTIKQKRWDIKIAPETSGKKNVFGNVNEIKRLVDETGCKFTLDFAHIRARNSGKINYKEIFNKFKSAKKIHIHFSGIEYGEKGEKKHKLTDEKELKKLLKNLPENKEITIINESPDPIGDSVLGLKIYENL